RCPNGFPPRQFSGDIWKGLQESKRVLIIFLISTIGTVAGTITAFFLFKDIIPQVNLIAAMLSGSYTGGGVNFAAMATRFDVAEGTVSSTVVADNLLMALYFLVIISFLAMNFFNYKFYN